MSNHVSCTVTDGIAHVRLERPDKLNALTLDILDDLVAVATRVRRDMTLRAVIFSGNGDAFCAGLDFASVLKNPQPSWAHSSRACVAPTPSRRPAGRGVVSTYR